MRVQNQKAHVASTLVVIDAQQSVSELATTCTTIIEPLVIPTSRFFQQRLTNHNRGALRLKMKRQLTGMVDYLTTRGDKHSLRRDLRNQMHTAFKIADEAVKDGVEKTYAIKVFQNQSDFNCTNPLRTATES